MLRFSDKILIILCLATFIWGCEGTTSFPGNDEILDEIEGNISTEEGQVPVLIDVGTFSGEIESDDTSSRTNVNSNFRRERNIYIYAFQRNKKGIFNISSSSDKKLCLIDAANNKNTPLAGKRAMIQSDSKRIEWNETPKTEYYPQNRIPYDFYGYYLDGAQIQSNGIDRNKDKIEIALMYDGNNDIMLAKSELDKEHLKQYSETEQEKIKNSFYSGFTTTINYNPCLKFKHVMSKFSFKILAMNDEASNVYVNDITCFMNNKLSLTVVGNNISELGAKAIDNGADFSSPDGDEKGGFHLREENNEKLQQNYYKGNKEDYSQIGGNFFLPPGQTEYTFRFKLNQETEDWESGKPYYNNMTISNKGKPFEPNQHYIVYIKVYGLQNIIPEVSVGSWEKGGEGSIDTDKPFLN